MDKGLTRRHNGTAEGEGSQTKSKFKILLCGLRGLVAWCEASIQALHYSYRSRTPFGEPRNHVRGWGRVESAASALTHLAPPWKARTTIPRPGVQEPGAYAAVPMPVATAFTSAPTFPQSLAVSFRYSTRYRLRMNYKAHSDSTFRRYPHTQP